VSRVPDRKRIPLGWWASGVASGGGEWFELGGEPRRPVDETEGAVQCERDEQENLPSRSVHLF